MEEEKATIKVNGEESEMSLDDLKRLYNRISLSLKVFDSSKNLHKIETSIKVGKRIVD